MNECWSVPSSEDQSKSWLHHLLSDLLDDVISNVEVFAQSRFIHISSMAIMNNLKTVFILKTCMLHLHATVHEFGDEFPFYTRSLKIPAGPVGGDLHEHTRSCDPQTMPPKVHIWVLTLSWLKSSALFWKSGCRSGWSGCNWMCAQRSWDNFRGFRASLVRVSSEVTTTKLHQKFVLIFVEPSVGPPVFQDTIRLHERSPSVSPFHGRCHQKPGWKWL